MLIDASAGNSRKDVRDHCYSLRFRSQGDDEARVLAAFYEVVVKDGIDVLRDWVLDEARDALEERDD